MRTANKDKAGVGIAAAAGIASCVLGSSVSFPLETVARRMQVWNVHACLMTDCPAMHASCERGDLVMCVNTVSCIGALTSLSSA